MKKLLLLAITSFSFLFISINVNADTRATSCHGCSAVQMSTQATNVAGVGLTVVYVFNQNTKSVNKYDVYTSAEDGPPFSIVKEAHEVAVEQDVKNSYSNFITSVMQAQSSTFILPPDFPVRSSAGALLAPNYTYGNLRTYLQDVPGGWYFKLNILFARLLTVNVPGFNISGLLPSAFVITVQFPDGSSIDFKIEFHYNANSDVIVVSPLAVPGSATDQNGNTIPELPGHFAGLRFTGDNSTLNEWATWAENHGMSMVGSSSGSGGWAIACTNDGICSYVRF